MGRYRIVVASVTGLAVVGCSSPPPVAEPAAVAEPAPVVAAEAVDAPVPAQLLAEYGELLLAAAASGGDALERTLAVTADDRTQFDPDCAPHWAHEILAVQGEDRDRAVPLDATNRTLTVGAVDVPVAVRHDRVVHVTGAPCDQRLPQPKRRTAVAASTAPEPPSSAPAPAPPTRVATPSPPPAQPPAREPAPEAPVVTEREQVEHYDAVVAEWSVLFVAAFEMAVETQRWFGQVGGGQPAADVYRRIHEAVGHAVGEFASADPPAPRTNTNETLLDGLSLWRAELHLLQVCAISPRTTECDELPTLRGSWQQQLAAVGRTTGTVMPSGHLTMPARGVGDPATSPPDGRWNIGDIRVPTEYEVRRSLQ